MSTVYNAVTTDATMTSLIGDRMYWKNPASSDTFPLLSYFTIDEVGNYSFGGDGVTQEAEDVTIQIDIYVNSILNMDAIKTQLKTVMNSIGFRQIGGAETFDKDLNKAVRATRWVLANVSDF